MKNGTRISPKFFKDLAGVLEEAGASVLFANRNLGCALAFVNTGKGVERRTHQFTTAKPITAKGALSRSARNELVAAGILSPLSSGSFTSTKRLIARGAMAAAFSGALLLTGGANNALAEDLGFTYYGGTNPLSEVLSFGAKPAFVDIDKDGDLDCFIGDSNGFIQFWKNQGTSQYPNFEKITGEANPLSNTVVNDMAAPAFVDIDGDGDMDAFVGHYGEMYQTWGGEPGPVSIVSFFENTGTPQSPVFDFNAVMTDSIVISGTVLVGQPNRKTLGYNPLIVQGNEAGAPTFADIDGDGDMDAFVGTEYGYIYGYENMTINTDKPDKGAITGTIGFMSHGPMYADFGDQEYDYISAYLGYATPTFVDADGDGDLDLFVGNKYGSIQYFENTGTAKSFQLTARTMADNPAWVDPGWLSAPAFADINGDGLDDLFAGGSSFFMGVGKKQEQELAADMYSGLAVRYYQNTGTASKADFRSRGDNPFNLGPIPFLPLPAFGDVDGDGDMDAFVGSSFLFLAKEDKIPTDSNKGFMSSIFGLSYYENIGSQESPVFAPHYLDDEEGIFANMRERWYLPAPSIADLNGDGINEIYIGFSYDMNDARIEAKAPVSYTGAFAAYQYVTPTMSLEVISDNPLEKLGELPAYPHAAFVDIDGDGDLDVFVAGSSYYSYDSYLQDISFFRNEGTPITPAFSLVTDTNPLSGVGGLFLPSLSFADVDGDGDMDAVLGDRYGWFMLNSSKDSKQTMDFGPRYFRNTGSATEPVFVEQFDNANPFDAMKNKTIPGAVILADLDNDQDPDAVMGDFFGKLYYYRNIDTLDEAANILKDDDDLCFIESARSDSSLWDKIAGSCKQGAKKIRNFFSPS